MNYPRGEKSILQRVRESLKTGYDRIQTDDDADEHIKSLSSFELLELVSDVLEYE